MHRTGNGLYWAHFVTDDTDPRIYALARQLGTSFAEARLAVNALHSWLVAHADLHADGCLGLAQLAELPHTTRLYGHKADALLDALCRARVLTMGDAEAYVADWRERFGNMRMYGLAAAKRARLLERYRPTVDANTDRRRRLRAMRALGSGGAEVVEAEAEVACAAPPSPPQAPPVVVPRLPVELATERAAGAPQGRPADDTTTTRKRHEADLGPSRSCPKSTQTTDSSHSIEPTKRISDSHPILTDKRSESVSRGCPGTPSLEAPVGGPQAGAPPTLCAWGLIAHSFVEGDGPPRPSRPVASAFAFDLIALDDLSVLRLSCSEAFAYEIAGARARGVTLAELVACDGRLSTAGVLAMSEAGGDEPQAADQLPIMAGFAGPGWSRRWLARRDDSRRRDAQVKAEAAVRVKVQQAAEARAMAVASEPSSDEYWASLMHDSPARSRSAPRRGSLPASGPRPAASAPAAAQRPPAARQAPARPPPASPTPQRPPGGVDPAKQPTRPPAATPQPRPAAPPPPAVKAEPPAEAKQPADAPLDAKADPANAAEAMFSKVMAEQGVSAALAMFNDHLKVEGRKPSRWEAESRERRQAERRARLEAAAAERPRPPPGVATPAAPPAEPAEAAAAPASPPAWTDSEGGMGLPYELLMAMGEQCRAAERGEEPAPLPDHLFGPPTP